MTNLTEDQITLVDEILTTCWEHLQEHKQPTNTAIYLSDFSDPNNKTLTWLSDPKCKKLTDAEALALLECWITEKIVIYGKLFLYTCPDNAEISIEDIRDDEDLSGFECHIPNIFYIGHD